MTARSLHVGQGPRVEGPTVRDAVLELLRAHGLTTIFGNPGSTELPMFRDLPQDFRYILGLQESVVLGMADGFAQATGRAAVVNLHSSAGVGHALGNLFTAYRNQTPLVVTAGQQARSILPYEPFLYAERPTEFPQPFVKWSCEPARAEDVPLAIARAYHIAMQAPRGPAFVSIPIDDWDRAAQPIAARRVSTTSDADPAMLGEVAELLGTAKRPVIVAGAGLAWGDARAKLLALAEKHRAPVWNAPMSARNAFPEDHALFAGFLAASREAIVDALAGHDLVLVLGAPVFTYHVEGFGPFAPEGAELVQIVEDPGMAARTPVGTAIVGNLEHALGRLLDVEAPAVRAQPEPRAAVPLPSAERLTDALLMARLAELRPKGIAVVEEAPSTRGPLHDYFPMLEGEDFHACASGGLGHALPAAVGVALGRPERPVLCILGDGSTMYSIQGLWSAVQLGADIRFVIVNNASYAALEQFGRLFDLEVVGSKLPGLNFVALANGHGMEAARIDRADQLDDALRALFVGRGPKLLEVVVTPVTGG